ncbi:MAG TPA: hypothetical protein VGK81_08690, partial [Anaerolineae bacterium]
VARLFRLRDCFDVVAALLARGNGDAPPCGRCAIRPRHVQQTVASDWDTSRQCLMRDSAAWEY